MKPFEAYKCYVAIKLHFQSDSYDYFKFNGKCAVTVSAFDRRKDRQFFVRLSKLYSQKDLEQLLVANVLQNENLWVRDILSERGRTIFAEWKGIQQSLSYHFDQDLREIENYFLVEKLENFNALFSEQTTQSNWPHIVSLVMQNIIRLETFLIMNKILNFLPKLNDQIADSIIWPQFYKKCIKYSPFIQVDTTPYKIKMRQVFLSPIFAKNACV